MFGLIDVVGGCFGQMLRPYNPDILINHFNSPTGHLVWPISRTVPFGCSFCFCYCLGCFLVILRQRFPDVDNQGFREMLAEEEFG